MVRMRELEHMKVVIDGLDKTDLFYQEMDGSYPTVSESTTSIRDLVPNIGGVKHRSFTIAKGFVFQSPLDSPLAVFQLLSYPDFHSKLLFLQLPIFRSNYQMLLESREFRVFSIFLRR